MPRSSTAVWGIRQDWSDGTHTLTGPYRTLAGARHAATRQHRYWTPGQTSPRLLTIHVVVTSAHELRLHHRHRPRCTAPDCPTPAPNLHWDPPPPADPHRAAG